MIDKKYLIWEKDGNAVVIEDTICPKIYLKFEKAYLNGGQPLKFFEMKSTGGSYGGSKVSCGFDNPHNPMTLSSGEVFQHDGRLYRDGDSICVVMGSGSPTIIHGCREIDLLEELIVHLPGSSSEELPTKKRSHFHLC